MGRRCLGYFGHRENISTSLQARSRLVMKKYEKLHCVHMRRKVKFSRVPRSRLLTGEISVTEIIFVSCNFLVIWTQLSRLAGKLSVYALQNLRHSGKLYPASGKTFPHMNRTKLFDLSKCFLGNRDNVCPYEQALSLAPKEFHCSFTVFHIIRSSHAIYWRA